MLDVLLLLAVTGRLLKCLDDKGGGGWDDGNSGLTVLDGESDGDSQSFLHNTYSSVLVPDCYSFLRSVHTQSPVAFAISSPTFFGDKPRGPILGANAEEAPTSPPVALRWLLNYR